MGVSFCFLFLCNYSNPSFRTDLMALELTQDALIPHESLNASASITILLIHGALSSKEEWNLVAPHLQSKYHLLIPDLPRHGSSSPIHPFTVEHINQRLAQLIKTKANDKVAHVVGLSLGAHVVVNFASAYPNLVLSVFATGMSRFAQKRNPTLFSYGFYCVNRLENMVPSKIMEWALPDMDFNIPKTACTVSLCRGIFEIMRATPERIPKRTLVIAAAKRGIIPTNDNLEDAKSFGEMAGRGSEGDKSRCVKHDGLRHAWSRQDPELFARTVGAWIESEQILPNSGFQDLI